MSFYPKLIGAVGGVCAAGALIYAGASALDKAGVYCLEIFQTAFENRNNTHAGRILIFKRHRGKIILQFFLGIPHRQRRFGRQNTVRRNACLIRYRRTS